MTIHIGHIFLKAEYYVNLCIPLQNKEQQVHTLMVNYWKAH